MKLRILAIAAGFVVLPAIAYAQGKDTTVTRKDTTAAVKDTLKAVKDTLAAVKDTLAAVKDTLAAVKDTTPAVVKDTTPAVVKDTTATVTRRTTRATRARRRANAAAAGAMAGDNTAARTSTSNGTDCPRGCPTSKGAAGLTGVQFLALQQELRDRGCGNKSVTGVYDAATRRAVAVCAKQLGVAKSASAVLVALNIGFSASDVGATPPKSG